MLEGAEGRRSVGSSECTRPPALGLHGGWWKAVERGEGKDEEDGKGVEGLQNEAGLGCLREKEKTREGQNEAG